MRLAARRRPPAPRFPPPRRLRRRAVVDAAPTPAARPAQRARASIGSRPPRLMSSTPLRSPLSSSTKSRKKPVGGRSASAAATRRFSACSRFGVRANAAARRCGHGRRAPDRIALDHHREQHQAAVAIGVLEPRPGGALPLADRAREQRAGRDRALGVGAQTARRHPLQNPPGQVRSSVSRSCGSSASSQASAQSTSELGNGSRRPKLPIASHVYGAGGRPSSCSAISISRRVIVSWMLAIVRLIAADGPAGVVKGDHRLRKLGGRLGRQPRRRDCARSATRRRNGARRSLAIRSTSSSTPTSRPAGLEHGQVADAVVEHLEQRLGLRAVRGHGPRRRGHHRRERGVRPGGRVGHQACGCRGR